MSPEIENKVDPKSILTDYAVVIAKHGSSFGHWQVLPDEFIGVFKKWKIAMIEEGKFTDDSDLDDAKFEKVVRGQFKMFFDSLLENNRISIPDPVKRLVVSLYFERD